MVRWLYQITLQPSHVPPSLPSGSQGIVRPDIWKAPSIYNAVPKLSVSPQFPNCFISKKPQHTSFLVTGFSSNTKCVNFGNVANTSKSANSAKLLLVSTRFVKFGICLARVGWMLETRLRANKSVCNLGLRGKFPRTWISLSVKSIASCGCINQRAVFFKPRAMGWEGTYTSNT